MQRILRRIKLHLIPYYKIEEEVPSSELRQMITTFSSHSGLCYAIMAGVSGAALLAPPYTLDKTYNENLINEWQSNNTKAMLSHYASKSIVPCFLISFYFNLQGLMTSMAVAGHINAVPLDMVKAFVARHTLIISTTGWCLVPAAGFLAVATAAYVHSVYDSNVDNPNGLTYLSLALFATFGLVSTYHSLRLLRSNVVFRQQYRTQVDKLKNQAVETAQK